MHLLLMLLKVLVLISGATVHNACILLRELQPSNAPEPIEERCWGKRNSVNDEQFAKAASPIVIQLSGMAISDNEEQPLNAASLIVLQLEGRTTLSKELHP